MQGPLGRIELNGCLALLAVASCSFPYYGFDEEPFEPGGAAGSVDGAAGAPTDAGGHGGTGDLTETPPPTAGQGGISDGAGGAAGAAGSAGSHGGRPEPPVARLCADLDSFPSDCRCWDYHDHAYLICSTPLAWSAAGDACGAYELRLATLQGPAENTWLVERAKELMLVSNYNSFWIGARSEGDSWTFRWPDGTGAWQGQADGMPFDGGYANWRNGNPDQGGCVSMGEDGWEDNNCADPRPFACESYP